MKAMYVWKPTFCAMSVAWKDIRSLKCYCNERQKSRAFLALTMYVLQKEALHEADIIRAELEKHG